AIIRLIYFFYFIVHFNSLVQSSLYHIFSINDNHLRGSCLSLTLISYTMPSDSFWQKYTMASYSLLEIRGKVSYNAGGGK
ncbi:MAG TPA: hypothetical protein VK469_16160, partial [Candidatus Kapabacteria bacterium]|nr:hypothetical protein [Candidatus Kapabacteria bacterium]